MTTQISLVLAAIILGILALDILVFDWGLLVVWGRRLAQLSEWMAFWR